MEILAEWLDPMVKHNIHPIDNTNIGISDMNIDAFDLNLLKTFDSLYRHRQLTKAAEQLCLSQPAVSHALKRLREAFNDPLFTRSADGMQPTPKALALAPNIQQALELSSAILASPISAPSELQRCFHVAMPDYLEAVLLPVLTRALRFAAPNVSLKIKMAEPESIKRTLATGELDFVVDYVPLKGRDIRKKILFEDRFVTIARAQHPIVGRTLSLDQFLACEHAVVEPRIPDPLPIDKQLKASGKYRKIAVTTANFLSIFPLVTQTDYLSTPPYRLARTYAEQFPITLYQTPLELAPFNVFAYWHRSKEQDPAHRWFRELIERLSF